MEDTKDKIENEKDQVVGRSKEEFGDATMGDMKERRSEARDGTLDDESIDDEEQV